MSGDLKWNKIFGAALATGLVILGVREVSAMMFAPGHESEKMGYQIEVAEETTDGPAPDAGPPDWGTVLASADLAKGEALFSRCTSCHKLDANGTGPGLQGIVGRGVASHPGFAYSEAMTGHRSEAPNWTYDALNEFLLAPSKDVPGTKMSFAGLKKVEDRINLIAWLRTQGSSGYPIPAPDPSRQAGAPAAAAAATPAAAEGASAQAGQTPVAGAAGQPTQQTNTVQSDRPAQPVTGTPAPKK